MTRYIVIFTVANLILTLVLGGIAEVLKLTSSSGLAVGAAMGASFLAAAAFAKDHDRPPSPEETKSFAWLALLSTWLVSLVLTAGLFAFVMSAGEARGLLRTFSSGKWMVLVLGIFFFVSAIYYFGIRWAFGWYGKQAVARKS